MLMSSVDKKLCKRSFSSHIGDEYPDASVAESPCYVATPSRKIGPLT